jgi:hypothetical protein
MLIIAIHCSTSLRISPSFHASKATVHLPAQMPGSSISAVISEIPEIPGYNSSLRRNLTAVSTVILTARHTTDCLIIPAIMADEV